MKKDVFGVKFISVRTGFLYFSENLLWKLNSSCKDTSALLVEYGCNQKAYFSWGSEASPIRDDSVVCVNSVYAQALGITEGDTVIVSLLSQVQPLSCIHVLPLSSDDWQILMLKSYDVQSSVLDQVRVVWPGQVLVIWVSKSFHLCVVVETVRPNQAVGILQPLTEVVVSSPDVATSFGSSVTPQSSSGRNCGVVSPATHRNATGQGMIATLFGGLRRWFHVISERRDTKLCDGSESGPNSSNYEVEINKLLTCSTTKKVNNWVFRVHPIETPIPETSGGGLLDHPYNVYTNRERLVALGVDLPVDRSTVMCKITTILFPKPAADKTPTSSEDLPKVRMREPVSSVLGHPYVFVRLCFLEGEGTVLRSQLASHPGLECALFTRTTMAALQVSAGAKVHVELISTEEPPPAVMELHVAPCKVWDASLGSIDSIFRRHVAAVTQKCSMLLNSNTTLSVYVTPMDIRDLCVKLVPSSAEYALLDVQSLANYRLCTEDSDLNSTGEVLTELHHDAGVEGKFFGNVNPLLEEGLMTLKLGLKIHQVANRLQYANTALSAMNILIVGKVGSGKSTLSKALCHQLGKSPHYVHSVHVQCRYLKGKKVETLQRLMVQWLEECVYYQPSILVLDDLEAIAGMPNSSDDASAEGLYYSRVGERLVDTLHEFQSVNDICVVSTTSSLKKLDHAVMSPRGRHVFHTVLEIQELTKADRLMSLEYILCRTACADGNLPPVDLDTVANQTEGYVIQDLVDLVDKATFEMWKRSVSDSSSPCLTDGDLEEAKRNMIPLSLRGVNLFRDSSTTWDDVGGLVVVKQLLEQILMWPSQYPELFVQCPLRHQSGMLLYGAPGTGKTHLAGAIAHHCGLNFISVKGPELLSKYIGASEEAVRNIFEKAQSAKPCILFFDEFDSLAPRRGHDSTGVTDRVVNQLLTQLDGVESLQGVWVVGATSRPDLLDPALLRPGRLDHAVMCPLPQKDDRMSILRALSRNLLLADNVDFQEIATHTFGFTGADLQALLFTAQLSTTNVAQSNLPDLLPSCSGMEFSLKPDLDTAPNGRYVVTQDHLLAALQNTRPSLSPQERLKYELIYQKFSNLMTGSNVEDAIMLPQRATLA